MKRIFCLVLSAVLLLGLIGVGASAEGQLKLVLTGGTAKPGQEVEVVLTVENNPGLKGISIYVDFNESVLSYVGFTDKTGLGGWNMISFADDHILMWNYDGIVNGQMQTYDGEELVALRFKVAEDAAAGDYAVSLLFDSDWDSVTGVVDNYVYDYDVSEFEIVPGKVTVPEPLNGYYLIGQNGWTVDDIDPEQKFVQNPSNSDEFLLETNRISLPVETTLLSSRLRTALSPTGIPAALTTSTSWTRPTPAPRPSTSTPGMLTAGQPSAASSGLTLPCTPLRSTAPA